jgi:putative endonuclease
MSSGGFTRRILASLDWAGKKLRRKSASTAKEEPEHLKVGKRGEEIAYFHLRELGYTVVARNWRNSRRKGELDIVAWDQETLCFVEVKTRTRKSIVPAEGAVNRDKMRELTGMARLYMRPMPLGTRFRFDVVTVYLLEGCEPEVTLFRDAFGWRTREYTGTMF